MSAPMHKNVESGCDRYGAPRLRLARLLAPLLADVPWWIENGTLLGAWRNGKMIPHDDDFDVAVLAPRDEVMAVMERLRRHLAASLPAPYAVRAITSYADKLEVYDPTAGSYPLPAYLYGNTDYHHVSVDVQMYAHDEVTGLVRARYRAGAHCVEIHANKVVPCGGITLEGVAFPCPRDAVAFLRATYGDIREGAVYNLATGLYEMPTDAEAE